ncbi:MULTISPECIES: urease subunit beta [Aerosakkonema]|uniref:urease subunit beta n=1 Tax=Aerosakkonema TaxID=1246629 RepID=UPI0035BA5A4A
MIPGEIIAKAGEIELNAGRRTLEIEVVNQGDRPIQVGSHFHFYEVNEALEFEREQTKGMRLNIAAGTAVRFEADGTKKTVELVEFAGTREIYGFNAKVNGSLR